MYIIACIAVNQNAVFTGAVDILETDITNITDIGVIFAAERGNGDRLCFSPPVIFGKQPRFNIQIGKSNIFDTALVP